MNATYLNERLSVRVELILLSTALIILGLVGCTTTPPATGPGTPDATQLQHYEMLKTAIEAKSKEDALAALTLLDGDVHRWEVNWAVIASTMHDQNALTEAVEKEDWPLANQRFQSLKSKYGKP
jgi:hypothetical protein